MFLVSAVIETNAYPHKYDDCSIATTRRKCTIDLSMWTIFIYLTEP